MNKLMSGLVDENPIMKYKDVVSGGYVEGTASDAEFVELFSKVKTLELLVLNRKRDNTKAGGGSLSTTTPQSLTLKLWRI